MSGKENTNDDAFVAFVQLRGLQRFTGQHGWVQMQASSKDNFDKLLRSTLAELHRNDVLDESQLLDLLDDGRVGPIVPCYETIV
jgi:hypothetical protein